MISITKKLLDEWFEYDNEHYFNNELRKPNWVISHNRSRYGQFRPRTWSIEISTAFVRSERDYHNTFLHELCHLYVRMVYGGFVQSHGYEWKKVAGTITKKTMGIYGTIQRVGGGQDKSVLRSAKMEKFVIFTDYHGNVAIGKYRNEDYVERLKNLNAIQSGTDIYYIVSDDVNLNRFSLRKVNVYSLRWNRLNCMSLDDALSRSTLIKKEYYSTLRKVG